MKALSSETYKRAKRLVAGESMVLFIMVMSKVLEAS